MRHRALIFGLLCFCLMADAGPARGAVVSAGAGVGQGNSAAPTAPVFSPDGRWARGMMIVVVGMFLAAAVIGPLYRMSLPEALPVTHSHDEPPGSSHHHGPGGTIEFSVGD